jgi:hypothetical protein
VFDAQAQCEPRARAYQGHRRREGTQTAILLGLADRARIIVNANAHATRILYIIYIYIPHSISILLFFTSFLSYSLFDKVTFSLTCFFVLCSLIHSLWPVFPRASSCVQLTVVFLAAHHRRNTNSQPQHGLINPFDVLAQHCFYHTAPLHMFLLIHPSSWTGNSSFYV